MSRLRASLWFACRNPSCARHRKLVATTGVAHHGNCRHCGWVLRLAMIRTRRSGLAELAGDA